MMDDLQSGNDDSHAEAAIARVLQPEQMPVLSDSLVQQLLVGVQLAHIIYAHISLPMF